MTVAQIANFACQTVGDVSSEMVDFAKDAIRLKYATLYDAHNWRESQRTLNNLPLDPTLNGSFFLPFDAEESIFCSLSRDGINFLRLFYRERDWIERFSSVAYSLVGNAPYYYRGENLAWPYINPGIFTFTTSDQSPINVYIEGKDANGFPVNESFILNAVLDPNNVIIPMSVSTVNSYSVVMSLSKDRGTLNVSALPSLIVMSPGTNELVFSQFVLYPSLIWTDQNNVPVPYCVRIGVKLKADTLDNDMSVPRISHIWDALIEFTLASLYTKARQLAKADAREQKAIAHIQAAVNLEKNQSESHQQVVPTIYENGDYIGRGTWVTSSYPFG